MALRKNEDALDGLHSDLWNLIPQAGTPLFASSVKKPVIVMSKQASTDSGGEGNGVLEEVVPKSKIHIAGLANDKVSYAIVLTTPISAR